MVSSPPTHSGSLTPIPQTRPLHLYTNRHAPQPDLLHLQSFLLDSSTASTEAQNRWNRAGLAFQRCVEDSGTSL